MILPKVNNDLFISLPSDWDSLLLNVFPIDSDPAKSTICNVDIKSIDSVPLYIDFFFKLNSYIQWDLDEYSFNLCEDLILFFIALFILLYNESILWL